MDLGRVLAASEGRCERRTSVAPSIKERFERDDDVGLMAGVPPRAPPPSGCGGKLESITALSVPWAGAEAFPAEAGFWPGADAAAAAAPTCRRRGGVVLGAEPAGACAAVGVGAGGVSGAGADCLLAVRFCALLTGRWLA